MLVIIVCGKCGNFLALLFAHFVFHIVCAFIHNSFHNAKLGKLAYNNGSKGDRGRIIHRLWKTTIAQKKVCWGGTKSVD